VSKDTGAFFISERSYIMQRKTRILALLLLAAMLISMIPAVFAGDESDTAVEAGEAPTEQLSDDGETLTRTEIMPVSASSATMSKSDCVEFSAYTSPSWHCNRYSTNGSHSYGHYYYCSAIAYHTIDGQLSYCIERATRS
jgi:hypothetical protein